MYVLPWLVYVLPCSDSIPPAGTSVRVELQNIKGEPRQYDAVSTLGRTLQKARQILGGVCKAAGEVRQI